MYISLTSNNSKWAELTYISSLSYFLYSFIEFLCMFMMVGQLVDSILRGSTSACLTSREDDSKFEISFEPFMLKNLEEGG